MIAGKHQCRSLRQIAMHIRIKRKQSDTALFFCFLQLFLIVLIRISKKPELCFLTVKGFCCGKQLLNPLFPHHAAHIQKNSRISFRVRLHGMPFQVHTGTGNQLCLLSSDMIALKDLSVFFVLKKDTFRLFQCCAVHGNDHVKEQSLFFKAAAKSCHCLHIGHSGHPAAEAAVNIRFDRIGQHQIRFFILDQPPVG